MFAALAAVLVTCLPAVVAPQDPAELFPAHTLLYFGTDSVQAGAQAARTTAMAKILDEAEVRAFMHKPMAAADGVLKAMLAEASDQMGGMPGGEIPDIKLNLSPDPESFAVGQAFMGLTHIGMPDFTTGEDAAPDIGLVLGVELLDAEHAGMLKMLWGSLESPEETGTHAGIDFMAKQVPETPMNVYMTFLGKVAVISLSEASIKGVMSRHAGDASDGSLAKSSEYVSMVKAAGGLRAGGSTNLVRVADLMGVVKMGLMMVMSAELSPEETRGVMELFEGLGMNAVKMVGGVSKVAADGMIHSTSVMSLSAGAPGLIPSLVGSTGSIDTGLLEEIPAETLGASMFAMGDQLVQVYDFCMKALGTMEPGAREEVEGMLDAMLGGSSIRDDILGNFQGNFVSYSMPGQGFPGTPESVMRFGLKNPESFVTAMENIMKAVSEEAGTPVSLKPSTHEGVSLYDIDLSATPVAMMMQPAFAIQDGELIFSTTSRRLKSTLNGAVTGESLAKNPALGKFIEGLGKGAGLQSLSFSDNAANFGTQYGQVAGFLPMMGAMVGDIPVDFSKLPPEKSISQYLSNSFGATYSDPSGLIVTQTVSQFQMMDFLPILMVGGLIAVGQAEGIGSEMLAVAEVDPVEQANLDLRELKAACTVYKISQGSYPESLAALLEPLPDYESGALPRDALPVDPWGNGYYFAMATDPKKKRPKPKIWSAGPNGMDEQGEGDDILKF